MFAVVEVQKSSHSNSGRRNYFAEIDATLVMHKKLEGTQCVTDPFRRQAVDDWAVVAEPDCDMKVQVVVSQRHSIAAA